MPPTTVFAALLTAAAAVSGTDPDPRALVRLEAAVRIDGVVDEAEWGDVAPLPLTMFEPTFRGEMTERTEIRIAYDDDALYVSGRFFDDPDEVRANSLVRDRYAGDDVMNVIVDTFNDEENALVFQVTPAGTRRDWAISNDGSGPDWSNPDWDTFWDAAAHRTNDGWSVEMRIPFSSLRFQPHGGEVVMGLIAHRFIVRKQELHTFPALPPGAPRAQWRPSAAKKIVLEDVQSPLPVYIAPYMLGGVRSDHDATPDAGSLDSPGAVDREIGVDAKIGLNSNLTLDLTYNTDFAQVEADDQQVNLTRFNLFFPEKRTFFQERAGIFNVGTGRQDRLFYSRRIGLGPDGQPIPILGGARLVGRVGDWDVGLLDMQVEAGDDSPAENTGVLRLRRRVLNANSYVGGMVTTRIADGAGYDVAGGLDGVVRVFGDDYLLWNAAATTTSDATTAVLDRSVVRARWERRGNDGLGYNLGIARIGGAYDPALGFVRRTGVTNVNAEARFGVYPERSRFRDYGVWMSGLAYLGNDDASLESTLTDLGLYYNLKGGGGGRTWLAFRHERLDEAFALADGTGIGPGEYDFLDSSIRFYTPVGFPLRVDGIIRGGRFYDGWRVSTSLRPSWNVSPNLELGGTYQLNRIWLPKQDDPFAGDIARLRALVALNGRLSANIFVQHNRAVDATSANVRLRYNFREGNDLYLVYNGRRTGLDPAAGADATRTGAIIVKYTHTFRR